MSIPPTLFKYANLAIGTLAALTGVSQLTQIFNDFNVFIQGLIAIVLSTFIIYLEFKIPSQLYKFASFYFSFLGRGALHILLASLLGHGVSFIRFFTILLLVFSGIGYFVCHFTKAVEEPDNFKINDNAIMVGDDQFDDDDDDEIV
ncbi:golgi apparatus membrane protein Tvp15p [Monosporozyma servazzii]